VAALPVMKLKLVRSHSKDEESGLNSQIASDVREPRFCVSHRYGMNQAIKMVISDYTLWEGKENIFPKLVQ
jgi:hypothetical protein